MRPHPDKRFHQMASVLTDLCAGCGICAGACPSSTPFRSGERIVSGIDMPQLTVATMRARLERDLATLCGETKVIVFGCDCAADAARVAASDTAVVSLLCTGMLPPSFVEYAIRNGADGVLVTGCREGDCTFRLGNRWVGERMGGAREPHLRANVPRERLRIFWAGPAEGELLAEDLARFRQRLQALGRPPGHSRSKRMVPHA
jgi:coenzyme F420-reducing hydrogenase delta subunit